MIIELKPEDEQLIQERLQSGAFASVEDVIHRALKSLEADEIWLKEEKDSIHQKISEGIAQLDRGEGLSPEESRAEFEKRRAAWIEQHRG